MGKNILDNFVLNMGLNMTKIYGSMVVRNEEGRYLESCILWMQQFVNQIFIYDDRSTDRTAEIALDLGCRVVRRPESNPSFIEHEGKFRWSAWRAFEKVIQPESDSWILSFDADEFLVAEKDIHATLEKAIFYANKKNHVGVILPFPEIFKIEDDKFYYRTDGLWNTIKGPRLFRYREGGAWKMKPMGCGSEPDYVSKGTLSTQNMGLTMLHLGYAKNEDKQAKYDRYSSLQEHGHNNKHIESIIEKPTLKLWEGKVPTL